MDDILYILIGIGWVAFGLYKNYQKQLAKNQKSVNTNETTNSQPSKIKDIFEQLFPTEETNVYESESQEFIYNDIVNLEEPFLKKEIIKEETKNENIKNVEIKVEKGNAIQTEFDLRNAVIYSMILERPYS